MSVTAADLLSPSGDLVPSLFPSDSTGALTSRLTAYLAEGETKASGISDLADRDRATLHWGYYRAYKAVHVRMSGDPLTSGLASGLLTAGYSAAQIANFAALRDEHLDAFTAIVPTDPDVAPTRSTAPRASSASGVEFAW